MTVVVQEARTAAECTAVRMLVDAHARFERSPVLISEDWPVRAAELIMQRRLHLLAALAEGVPVGYATLTQDVSTWTATPFAHLDCLYVDSSYRGNGTGRLLFEAAVQHAHTAGLTQLQWQTPEWNTRAAALYRAFGGEPQQKLRFTLDLE